LVVCMDLGRIRLCRWCAPLWFWWHRLWNIGNVLVLGRYTIPLHHVVPM